LKIEISCIQWQGSACTHDGRWFFLEVGGGGWGELFFILLPSSISAPAISLWPKMVINSFGNKKYMQPMGRLKHALKVP